MKNILFSILIFFAFNLFSAPGDTTKIISHNSQTIITNPGFGFNEYKNWVVFPNPSKKFRKVFVTMQYKCPAGMPCGAWDYIDNVILRRVGGKNFPSKDMEIVRFITPYGNGFGAGWKFQWHMDVTDYQLLLHDSVEVGYIHTGYEGTNVGWNLTLTFNFIEGPPVYEPVKISTLWDKNYWWSQVSDSTKPQTVSMLAQTNIARMRINHTGHGADTVNYCSEFCPRYRSLKIDGTIVDSVNVWRGCGHNALYPQGGTWVYDRGGWCPGAVVFPYAFDKPVSGASTHTFDINVSYPFKPTNQGNEVIVAHLIECLNPQFANDASIEELFNPSLTDEYIRLNPSCAQPQIIIRNNGTATLTSLNINYALSGQTPLFYNWTGNLATYKVDTVTLPGVVNPTVNAQPFKVYCSNPNGSNDMFKFDDTLRSLSNKVSNYINDTIIIVELITNNLGFETGWQLYNDAGSIIKQRVVGTLANNTTYKDTVHLPAGCYKIKINDAGGDGLYFWANPPQGSGILKFKKISGTIFKTFPTDFGSAYRFSFTTGAAIATAIDEQFNEREILLYPNPANDYFGVEINFAKGNESIKIEMLDAIGKIVLEKTMNEFAGGYLSFKTNNFARGLYFVNISGKDFKVVKKLVVE